MNALLESHKERRTKVGGEEGKMEEEKKDCEVTELRVADLIRDDWQDFVSTFYFPRLSKEIKDQRLRDFIDQTNRELLEPGQEVAQIKMIA